MPAGASSFSEALRIGAEVFQELRYTLLARGRGSAIGSDGGFAPDLESNESALETLVAAITAAGYEPGWDVWIGIDAAASQLRVDGAYSLAHEGRLADPPTHLQARSPARNDPEDAWVVRRDGYVGWRYGGRPWP